MTFNEARDAMLAPFVAQWLLSNPSGAVQYPDKPFETPTSTDPWARVIVRHGDGGQSSLTGPLEEAKRYTNTGVLFIQLMAPVGEGYDRLYALGQDIVVAYRKSRHPNVWFRRVRCGEVATRGPWAQLEVKADFTYDDIN